MCRTTVPELRGRTRAEGAGFEPAADIAASDRFQGGSDRPLRHPSWWANHDPRWCSLRALQLDGDEDVALLDDVALTDLHGPDGPGLLGEHRYLHLHRLQQDHGVPDGDPVPGRDG